MFASVRLEKGVCKHCRGRMIGADAISKKKHENRSEWYNYNNCINFRSEGYTGLWLSGHRHSMHGHIILASELKHCNDEISACKHSSCFMTVLARRILGTEITPDTRAT